MQVGKIADEQVSNVSTVKTETTSPPRRDFKSTRHFTKPNEDVYATQKWEKRTASITEASGEIVFEQEGVEAPESWSQLAVNVVASKYFRGHIGEEDREYSVKQLIGRVADTIAAWGLADGYFDDKEEFQVFRDELTYLLLHQHLAFNSPVWFNVGARENPQCSACFIQSVEDDMESIMGLATSEVMLFKGGSGTGSNLSRLRASTEPLNGGGIASGPVSFMKGYDAFAGVIKSGGRTRRAAKMIMLDSDHPDILEFIRCKAKEEKKARDLIAAGYSNGIDGDAYSSVFFQNANHSVRASDAFFRAAEEDKNYETTWRTDGRVAERLNARDVLMEIAQAAWECGDPGIQYDDTINTWHTCKGTDRIYGSNPCSEFMFLDDTSCNLASLNLMKFRNEDGSFNVEGFKRAASLSIIAQEIIVSRSSYPTATITENSERFRPLGLGYANLGALLMSKGLPYDSDAGREFAAAVTSLMCGQAYETSALIAKKKGAFEGYTENIESMTAVIAMHRDHSYRLSDALIEEDLVKAARSVWDDAIDLGLTHGFRNSQVTVLAPTGTIAFMMDCDTTGIEPDIGLVKYKKLVGGGTMEIVNQTVPLALQVLGYKDQEAAAIVDHIDENGTIEGAPNLKDSHLPVFDCAFRPDKGERSIGPMGHVKMMSAVQPFLSGAISKTVNMPEDSTVQDIYDIYVQGWRLGVKAIAVYRDNCKRAQPLSTSKEEKEEAKEERAPMRRRLPAERDAKVHKFSVAGHEGYITVGLYEDGTPGEIFITMSKGGSTMSGTMDAIATLCSISLQYGVPLDVLVSKFSHVRFEPSGFTGNKDLPMAKSLVDYVFRWLGQKFGGQREAPPRLDSNHPTDVLKNAEEGPVLKAVPSNGSNGHNGSLEKQVYAQQADAPSCPNCGSITTRNGSCYACRNCGSTTGCS